MLRVDVSVPDSHPIGYVVPADNPFVGGAARDEIWSFGWRNPWRYTLRRPVARRHRRDGRGGRRPERVGRSRLRAAPAAADATTAGATAKGRTTTSPRGRRRSRRWSIRFTSTTTPAGSSITGGYVYRGAALGAAFRGRYFFADFIRSRVWSLALTIDAGGEARASDVREHTAELGGTAQLAGVSSFGVDADGELYIVSYSRGVVLKIIGPPPTPGTLRIIR